MNNSPEPKKSETREQFMKSSSTSDFPSYIPHPLSTKEDRNVNRECENFQNPQNASPPSTPVLTSKIRNVKLEPCYMHYYTHAITTCAILPISLAVSRISPCTIPCLLGKQDLGFMPDSRELRFLIPQANLQRANLAVCTT
jgi:hypothetical protein